MTNRSKWTLAVCVLAALLTGCAENRFEQELDTEKSAIKLARETQRGEYDLITTDELKKLLADKEELLLIDAMPADAFSKEHIPSAVNFPFPKTDDMPEWDASETGGRSQDDYAAMLPSEKDDLVVIYCGYTACARSHNAAAWARQLGYTNVKRYAGGIYAWKGAKQPIEGS